MATVGFWAAAGFAIVTITQVARTLFPRARASKPSLFYFGAAAAYRDADAYRAAVERSRERDLIETLSIQAWKIARIAADKYAQLCGAYLAVAVFLVVWAVARIALTLT